jgi:hypothetical protein
LILAKATSSASVRYGRVLVHDQDDRLAAEIGDVGEVPKDVERYRREHRIDDEAAEARQHEGVAIGRRARDLLLTDDAAGAGPVLDHERLPERRAELLRHDSRQQIGGTGGRERHHDLDRPHRPRVGRLRRRCETAQCGQRESRHARKQLSTEVHVLP